ncbi:MAG TPA: DMT family transporter [Candidatus Bathyarchaeia archaeon]|nr:DMT family transporter [Candidatus Bathyarchaeia archaeon]
MVLGPTAGLIIAIFLQLISASVNFIGMTIQKKAATKIPKISKETGFLKSIKNMLFNKAWIFGLVLNSSSTLFAAGAFALASISIIQPLYGFGLIVLVIFIHFYLKERITRLDILGVIFGAAGIVVIGLAATPTEALDYTVMRNMFISINSMIFFGIISAIALIAYIVSEKTKKTTSLIFLVISSAIWTSTQNIFNKAVATSVGDLGLKGALFGDAALYSWVFILMFLFVSIIGIIMLNIAYQNGHGVIILPIWTAIQVIIPVLSGIIIFDEWNPSNGLTETDIIVTIVGIVIMLASIIILSISNGRKESFSKLISATSDNGDSNNEILVLKQKEDSTVEGKEELESNQNNLKEN